MIKVLVADDHDLVRAGITRMLDDVPAVEVVGEVSTGEDAVDFCRKNSPDVVLMDIHMPGIGGLEATRKIVRGHPETRVIAVTVSEDGPLPSRLLQAGACGYLTKGAGVDEMVSAIESVARGKHYLSPDIAQKLALKQYENDGHVSPFDQLSDREMQIAMMIVGCQKVQAISDKLCLSPKTVNSYRYRIFDKLNISSDVELTLAAIKYGIVEVERSP